MDEQETPADTRTRILEAATAEFSEQGLAGARVDQIARRAGVNKAMIYYHFSSKINLYKIMFASQIEKLGKVMNVAVDPATDLETSLKKMAQMYHDILGGDHRFSKIFLHELASGGEILRETLEGTIYQQHLPKKMINRFEDGIKAGRLRRLDPRQAMVSFVGMNLFYLLMAPIANFMLEIEDANKFRQRRPDEVVDLFLRGLEGR
jgi:TetR/AcrR family transcriptional regulator